MNQRQCGNIALRTNRAQRIYGIRTYHIYRQISVFTISVGLPALAPINTNFWARVQRLRPYCASITSGSVPFRSVPERSGFSSIPYLSVQNSLEWASMFVSMLKRPRATPEDGCYHTVLWLRR